MKSKMPYIPKSIFENPSSGVGAEHRVDYKKIISNGFRFIKKIIIK